ncbi:MAG: hypothetical protein M3Z16_02310, partial [Pseudomonadota bacterium]|nr:hypothetical protein [Pseudomonadota bacterium]
VATNSAIAKQQAPSTAGASGPPLARWLDTPLSLGGRPPGRVDASEAANEAALADWLRRLDAAASGRWVVVSSAGHAVAPGRDGAAVVLRLHAARRRLATLHFEGDSVFVDVAGGSPRIWRADLSPEVASALRASAPARLR